jgi:hypothetical protein
MNTRFCFKLSKTPTENYEMLRTAHGDEALSCSSVLKWFKWYKEGHEALQDDQKSGHPSTSRNADTIANVREMVTRDRQWALKMLDELNINKEMIHQILHEDLWKKISTKFIPNRLTDEQKQWGFTSCQDFIQTYHDNTNFLEYIFLFPKVKTALKERGFRMLKTLRNTRK